MTDIFGPGVAASQQTNFCLGHVTSRESSCLPERADDCPAVAAGVDLELVGVRVLKGDAVSQPQHVRGVLFLAAPALQGTLHLHGFAQGRDDRRGTPLKLQIFDQERKDHCLVFFRQSFK